MGATLSAQPTQSAMLLAPQLENHLPGTASVSLLFGKAQKREPDNVKGLQSARQPSSKMWRGSLWKGTHNNGPQVTTRQSC